MNAVTDYLAELALAAITQDPGARSDRLERAADLFLALSPEQQAEAEWLKDNPRYVVDMRD